MSFDISYVVNLVDQFSGEAKKIVAATVAMEQRLGNFKEKADKMSQSLRDMGGKMSLYLTAPLAGIGGMAVKAFASQERELARLDNALRATGNVAGVSRDRLIEMANAIQKKTTFSDDQVNAAQATLLQFTNVRGKAFEMAQNAAVDLAAFMKSDDLEGTAKLLGKALQDPARGMMILRRSGVAFTSQQEDLIKKLMETGKIGEAQAMMFAELKKRVGGAGEAMAKVGLGPMQMMKNNFDDMLEDVGGIILDGLSPFINKLNSLIDRFKALSPETKKTIVIIAGIAAAIGPVLIGMALVVKSVALMAVGFGSIISAMGTVISVMRSLTLHIIRMGFALMANPIGLIVIGILAAVAAFIYFYKTSETFRNFIDGIANTIVGYFKTVYDWINKAMDLASSFITKVASFFGANTNMTAEMITKADQAGPNAQRMLGVGGLSTSIMGAAQSPVAVNSAANKDKVDVNIKLNDPGQAVQSVQTKKTDNVSFGLNLGRNMASAR